MAQFAPKKLPVGVHWDLKPGIRYTLRISGTNVLDYKPRGESTFYQATVADGEVDIVDGNDVESLLLESTTGSIEVDTAFVAQTPGAQTVDGTVTGDVQVFDGAAWHNLGAYLLPVGGLYGVGVGSHLYDATAAAWVTALGDHTSGVPLMMAYAGVAKPLLAVGTVAPMLGVEVTDTTGVPLPIAYNGGGAAPASGIWTFAAYVTDVNGVSINDGAGAKFLAVPGTPALTTVANVVVTYRYPVVKGTTYTVGGTGVTVKGGSISAS